MLKRLLLLGVAVAVLSLTAPGYAGLDPTADVLYHPVNQATAEATLTQQIQATKVTAQGAYGNDPPPPDSELFADSHTVVRSDVYAGGGVNFFSVDQWDSTRVISGNPVGDLQGVLLYFTVHLKSGRQVLDNESTQKIDAAIVDIGVSLSAWCNDPVVGLNFLTNPRVTKSGSLAADADGADWDGNPYWYPDVSKMTPQEIEDYSTGPDRLAAIIDPNDPGNSYAEQPIYTISDPDQLAAFTGSGKITFGYLSNPTTSHFVGSQDFVEWCVSPMFDIEARVVYLYTGIPEPATMGLLSAAFLPVLARRFRRKNRK